MVIDFDQFPQLAHDGYAPHSDPTPAYNCLAFAAGIDNEWWQPGFVWPAELSDEDLSVTALIAMFERKGFELCPDGSTEAGVEKIALYGGARDEEEYEHASRQLEDGRWVSKLGKGEDIIHPRAESVAGGLYGELRYFMKRGRRE